MDEFPSFFGSMRKQINRKINNARLQNGDTVINIFFNT